MSVQSENEFKPNEEILECLITMGIPKRAGELALYYTGNSSADAAAAFYFDNPDIDEASFSLYNDDVRETHGHQTVDVEDEEEVEFAVGTRCKMVFVVNTSLGMGVGKVAAQVGHATLGLYKSLVDDNSVVKDLQEWENFGEKKVVVKGETSQHLLDLYKLANDNKIHSYLVQDAGYTQIEPGSITVLGLFGHENVVNTISGTLKLL
ncbi:probable peptidyl-tRNA hydrolase 2 [Onthophagus taurus]|uniref:probable peptidyl-tRNA hydrolase 2 n=1 Tax=Onthophagus taurus TaxID=166361 RepID=UPI000C20101F|nr:probable peptidyl-tRNA hydrolase 2 [Onthophagus taurus]